VTHELIDAAHLGHDRIDRLVALGGILGPQLHVDARAHDGLGAIEPGGFDRLWQCCGEPQQE